MLLLCSVRVFSSVSSDGAGPARRKAAFFSSQTPLSQTHRVSVYGQGQLESQGEPRVPGWPWRVSLFGSFLLRMSRSGTLVYSTQVATSKGSA